MENNKIGKFIASHRKERGLTQQELADKLFITDKAVSKWERGLSLPDIALLEKLAIILEVNIADILTGQEETNRKINVEEEIRRITNELNVKHCKKTKKIILFSIILIIFILYIIFRNIFLGYDIKSVGYSHSNRDINIGVPKTSFMMKHNDRSYSYKNLRSSNIIENEIKRYLKTLKYSNCNNTIYYYNEKDNFSIINYSVKNHILYNTISYEIVDNDYCYMKKVDEYSEKLGGLKSYHSMDDEISFYEDWDSKLTVLFIDGGNDPNKKYEFEAQMTVIYHKRKEEFSSYRIVLEDSIGDIEIKDNKLYFYRKEIKEKNDTIDIPEVSTFLIEDGKLTLLDNYLYEYYDKDIILK